MLNKKVVVKNINYNLVLILFMEEDLKFRRLFLWTVLKFIESHWGVMNVIVI